MNGPDFIVIGVQRGGTSWLYKCFDEHPEIFMPQKEVHFFDLNYERGINWYASLFDKSNQNLIKGEMTPDYIFNKTAMTRIRTHYPKAKIIVILRDPFERAYSSVGMMRAHGRFKDQTFAQVIEKENWIIEQSLYFSQLEHLFSLYPQEQIQIFLFEDIAKRPIWLLQNLFNFIGADAEFKPKIHSEKFNVSDSGNFLNLIKFGKIQKTLKKYYLGRAILQLKKLKLLRKIKSKLSNAGTQQDLKLVYCSANLREKLKQDIIKTEKLLGVNLKNWH